MRGNPLRAGLGALAVAVAVATIVVVVTALDGLGRYARATGARAFGSDTFLLAQIATAGQITRRELAEKQQRNPAMGGPTSGSSSVTPARDVMYAVTVQRVGDVTAGSGSTRTRPSAAPRRRWPNFATWASAAGRFLQPHEAARGAQVAVIGADVADELFPGRRRARPGASGSRAAASRSSASSFASARRAARRSTGSSGSR